MPVSYKSRKQKDQLERQLEREKERERYTGSTYNGYTAVLQNKA